MGKHLDENERRPEKPKAPRRRLRMSPAWLDAVRPEARPVEYRDTDRRGLVLRVEASGRMTWTARYRVAGRERRFILGTYPETALKAARKAALDAIGAAQRGEDPQTTKERTRVGSTVLEAMRSWLDDEKVGPAARWKGGLEGGSVVLDERKKGEERAPLSGTARSFLPHVRRFVKAFGARKLGEITPRDVERFVSEPASPATRNRALQAIRMFVSYAKRKGLLAADPSASLSKERETERARTLTDDELRILIRGFDATRYGRAVRLLALSGLRRDEVIGARWSWLEGDVLTIPPESEKMGRVRGEPRRVPLSPAAAALLAQQREALFAEGVRSEFIFATSSGDRPHPDVLKSYLYRLKGRRGNGLKRTRADKRAKAAQGPVLAPDVWLHDVRRTVGDALLNRLKVAPWIIDHVVLGHARPRVLRTYQPTLPLDEARDALKRWSELLDMILSTTPEEQHA